jgi:hypothetical protein
MYEFLKERGSTVVDQCKRTLYVGWAGWKYTLEEKEIDDFFSGKAKHGERVGQLLFDLGRATEPSVLFTLFM